MQNLRDKLMKAGLVTEDQAKKAETQAPAAPRAATPPPRRDAASAPRRDDTGPRRDGGRPQGRRPGGPPSGRPGFGGSPARPGSGAAATRPGSGAPAARPVPKLPPLPGSKAFQREESKRQVELDRKLRELVHTGQVAQESGETTFYFLTRKGKLRRLELTPAQAKQLEDGELAVVERPEPAQIEHSLVPGEVAVQMLELSKRSVRFLNRKESPIGFMNDDEVKSRQAAEDRGEEPPEASEPDEESAQDAGPQAGTEAAAGETDAAS